MNASFWIMLFSHNLAASWHGGCGFEESLEAKIIGMQTKPCTFLQDHGNKTEQCFCAFTAHLLTSFLVKTCPMDRRTR